MAAFAVIVMFTDDAVPPKGTAVNHAVSRYGYPIRAYASGNLGQCVTRAVKIGRVRAGLFSIFPPTAMRTACYRNVSRFLGAKLSVGKTKSTTCNEIRTGDLFVRFRIYIYSKSAIRRLPRTFGLKRLRGRANGNLKKTERFLNAVSVSQSRRKLLIKRNTYTDIYVIIFEISRDPTSDRTIGLIVYVRRQRATSSRVWGPRVYLRAYSTY